MAGLISTSGIDTTIPAATIPTVPAPDPTNALTLSGSTPTPTIASQSQIAGETNTVPSPPVATAQPRNVTENETVSGQLNQLLSKDSQYIQSARNSGMAQANSRGLLNSSLAAGTAEKAAIDAALPIATSDASTYSNSGLSAQQAAQDTSLTGYKAQLDAAQQATNFGYNTSLNQQNIKGNIDISKQAQDAALVLKNLDISQQDKASMSSAIGPIIQQYQSEVSKIQSTADATMSPNAKQAAIDFQNNLFKAQLSTLSSLYGYNITWDTPDPNVPGATLAGTVGTGPGTNTNPNPNSWTDEQLSNHDFNPGPGYTWKITTPAGGPFSGVTEVGKWVYGTT